MQTSYYFHSNVTAEDKKMAEAYLGNKINDWDKFFVNSPYPAKAMLEIEFMVRKKHHRVELQLETPWGNFIGTAKKHTVMEGIDAVLESVKRQLNRKKDKMQTLRRRGRISLKKRFSITGGARFRKPE